MSQFASNSTAQPSVPGIATISPARPIASIGCNADARTERLDDLRADHHGHVSSRDLVEISQPEKVIRRRLYFSGMAAETVIVTDHGRIDFRYQGRLHLLVLFESGVRSGGCTLVEGVSASTLSNCARKLVLVPAGHDYSDWHESSRVPRLACFYFDPAMPAMQWLSRWSGSRLMPRIFFEHDGLWNTASKLKELIESPCGTNRDYCEALQTVLAHELARFAGAPLRSQLRIRGGSQAGNNACCWPTSRLISQRTYRSRHLPVLCVLAHIIFPGHSSSRSAVLRIVSTCSCASNVHGKCWQTPRCQ
jgi:hypothetical protein